VCKPLEEALADAKAKVNDLKEKERLAQQKYESARKDVDISEGDLRRFETKAKETAVYFFLLYPS
jgi:multidrug resistance efflux pump